MVKVLLLSVVMLSSAQDAEVDAISSFLMRVDTPFHYKRAMVEQFLATSTDSSARMKVSKRFERIRTLQQPRLDQHGKMGTYYKMLRDYTNARNNPPTNTNQPTVMNTGAICDKGDWEFVGPILSDATRTFSNMGRIDVVDCITDPSSGDPMVIFAGSYRGGLWKTTKDHNDDFGNDWECLTDDAPLPIVGINDLLIHPTDPTRLWISTEPYGLFYSNDGGNTWVLDAGLDVLINNNVVSWFERSVTKIAIDPLDSEILYVCVDRQVYKRTSTGSWQNITPPVTLVNGAFFNDVECTHINLNSFLAVALNTPGNNGRLFVSSDRGGTWTEKTIASPNGYITLPIFSL